ncbi:MAG: helix-turn-helix domain-containing protein [bacterium]
MARKKDKQKALAMRRKGMSYSQIKGKLGVSKSTLSGWLYNMPLSKKRIRELQADNPIRIERYRNTMRAKKETRLKEVYRKISKDIGNFSKRDLFLAGLFLYWGEGTKAQNSSVVLTNTNPSMLKFFIKWLELFNIKRTDLKIKLHLYSDMSIKKSLDFWSKELRIPISQFRKPYIKKTQLKSISYKNGFGKGTCCVMFDNRDLWEYVIMGMKYISEVSNNNIRP